ncbi:MAG TPA: hypothetical protein DIW24_09470 [Bacteroidetes bacterium]|nr:hypothetical protein [Bacteroidota bacterium]
MDFMTQHILLNVFIVCFLGATLLPLPTEAALLGAVYLGESVVLVWLLGSVANILGAFTNYLIGAYFADRAAFRLHRSTSGRKAMTWYSQYGPWSMVGSWLPVIGDPLCLTAGIFRMPLKWFFLGQLTRSIRYLVVVSGFMAVR